MKHVFPPLLVLAVTVAIVAARAPLAAADAVYHTEHLALTPVGGAPLRSGFVQNIKAQGPNVYAHELFVLNGAAPNTTFTVTRRFFFLDPECDGTLVFPSDLTTLESNQAGNAKDDIFVRPEDTAGFAGVHGVLWTVTDGHGAIRYRTVCTAVTLD